MSDWTNRIKCGFNAKTGPDTPASVDELERLIGVTIPGQLREFLVSLGGVYVNAYAPCDSLTPFGEWHSVTELQGVQDIVELLGSAVTPRNMICIGYGHNGATTCLSVAGLDHGKVFALDTTMRYFWDAETLAGLPDLSPSIREFFRLRDAGELPERPWGYENCYELAESFEEFLASLRSEEEVQSRQPSE